MNTRLFLCLLACGCGASPKEPTAPPIPGAREVVFEGMCDASGAVALSDRVFVVADDEDNVLRTYDADRGGRPLAEVDLSNSLGLPPYKKRAPETDLEAATLLGGQAYWLSSHGRNQSGKRKDERLRFFATSAPRDEHMRVEMIGGHYDRLLDDLSEHVPLAALGIPVAKERAPRDPGGLNIEGMTATPEDTLLLGFRNPVPHGKALVVPLLNGPELVGTNGARAKLGDPMLLDLAGGGIRALSWWRGRYIIAAGNVGDGLRSRLYTWTGQGAPEAVPLALGTYNPEAFFTPEDRDEILVLSDDGTVSHGGTECKRLRDSSKKRFRGVWIRLDAKPADRL